MVTLTRKFKERSLLLFTSCSAAWILKSLLFQIIIRYSGKSSLCNLFHPLPFSFVNWLFCFPVCAAAKAGKKRRSFPCWFISVCPRHEQMEIFNHFLILCVLKHFYSVHETRLLKGHPSRSSSTVVESDRPIWRHGPLISYTAVRDFNLKSEVNFLLWYCCTNSLAAVWVHLKDMLFSTQTEQKRILTWKNESYRCRVKGAPKYFG